MPSMVTAHHVNMLGLAEMFLLVEQPITFMIQYIDRL